VLAGQLLGRIHIDPCERGAILLTGPLRSVLNRLVDSLDAFVTHRADARARAMGPTIERIPGTRIHVYSRGGRGFSARPAALSIEKGGEHR
jgi:hypothetical protein